LGAFNIHPSLLPKYPGLNPWEAIFRNHEQEGGVTLHRITEHIDAGPIIYQATFPIVESDTVESARTKADNLASELVVRLIESYS
jgi:phosphoribosylglycinamide formyltransferase-1